MTIYKKRKQVIKYPIIDYDKKGNLIHYKTSDGYEYWKDYDKKGNLIHSKNSNGYEYWKDYNKEGKLIHYKDSNGYEYWKDYYSKSITEEEFNKLWEEVE